MEGNTDYKTEKEAFVSGMTGSSVGHVNMLSLAALVSIALHSALRTRLPPQKTANFLVEYSVLVVPILLSVTTFALSPGYLALLILLPTSVLLLVPPREAGTPLPSTLSAGSRHSSRRSSPPNSVIPPLAALTTYRAHMLLLTAICILAVDFPVFPRALAKCETFGASLMDMGVGSFIFSQGIVSAIPLIKNPAHLKAPVLGKVFATVRKCLPLLVLGLLRTLSVKGTQYPEHETEYGRHWNFFLTLGTIPILQILLHPIMIYMPISALGVILALIHQAALSSGGLMLYVLHAPRDSLVSANKEGIVSLTGYLALHLLGVSAGTVILPSSPSLFRRMQHQLRHSNPENPHRSDSESDDDGPSRKSDPPIPNRRENDKTATELCSYAVLWWTMLGILGWLEVGGGISRRVVNLRYIIWVAAFNTTFLLGYLLLDLVFFPSPLSKSVYSPTSKLKVQPDTVLLGRDRTDGRTALGAPALLEAINRNGLVFFLLANVMTGLVNLVIPTMYIADAGALAILAGYSAIVCGTAWAARGKRLWRH
ncbi:GWT1-domain-containing protein [Phanerochaete sordida]|uniref:GPI-anchored wall transfer protein n=1 Tax=Phanerochaete sordida TaxID=48140 RepID=A0A9P3GE76_9APHY|nr:GWT1-domain-containing protein [Phanerochaete sordida]